jgi:hypothetical protein
MKILAITRRRPGATAERIQALQIPEAREVWRLQGEGFIREIHFDPTRPCVILVLEAESSAAAQERLAGLPMVQQDLIEFDVYELRPYRQLERLFAG